MIAKHGVSMLESSARIAEKLARIDQPKQGNVFTNQANIAQNQVVQNVVEPINIADNAQTTGNPGHENQVLESRDDLGSNVSGLDAGKKKENVGRHPQVATVGKINRAENRGR